MRCERDQEDIPALVGIPQVPQGPVSEGVEGCLRCTAHLCRGAEASVCSRVRAACRPLRLTLMLGKAPGCLRGNSSLAPPPPHTVGRSPPRSCTAHHLRSEWRLRGHVRGVETFLTPYKLAGRSVRINTHPFVAVGFPLPISVL